MQVGDLVEFQDRCFRDGDCNGFEQCMGVVIKGYGDQEMFVVQWIIEGMGVGLHFSDELKVICKTTKEVTNESR